MAPRCSVPAPIRIADVSVVENAVRQPVKNMTLVKDLWSTVWQKPAAFGFNGENGEDFGSMRSQHDAGRG
jgi:hypothetical protein